MAKIYRVSFLICGVLLAPLTLAQDVLITHGAGTRFGTIDTATAAGTDVGATGQTDGWGLAIDVDNTIFTTYAGFSGDAQLATIDASTGAIASTIGGLGVSLIAIEIDASGQLWGVGYNDQVLYRIDKSNASTTAVGSTGISIMMDLSFDSSGSLYATTGNVLYSLNLATGAPTFVATYTGIASGEVMSIMHDDTDRLFAAAYVADSPLYEIDPSTGAATTIGATGLNRPHGGDITNGSVAAPGPARPVPVLPYWAYGALLVGFMLLAGRSHILRSLPEIHK